MELTIKNIGKIRDASIQLNGLTVIAGVNNTGKSTVGKSLFAICDAFYNTSESIRMVKMLSIANAIVRSISKNFHFYPSLIPVINDVENIIDVVNSEEKMLPFIEDIPFKIFENIYGTNLTQEKINKKSVDFAEYTKEVLKSVKTVVETKQDDLLTNIVTRSLFIEFKNQVCCTFNENRGELELSDNNDKVLITINNGTTQNAMIDNFKFQTEYATYIDNAVVSEDIKIEYDQFIPFLNRLYGHKRALKAALLKKTEDFNLFDNIAVKGKLNEIFKKLNDINIGALIQDKDNWRYRLANDAGSFLLNLDNVSTGILTFATLRRLIENGTVQEGGILILDEPETHLHPRWQNIFAEIIVLLCKELNLKVLMNTHSHYFLTAVDVFSKKHQIKDKCKYYLSLEKDTMAEMHDVTNDLDKIYRELWQPIQDMNDIEENNE